MVLQRRDLDTLRGIAGFKRRDLGTMRGIAGFQGGIAGFQRINASLKILEEAGQVKTAAFDGEKFSPHIFSLEFLRVDPWRLSLLNSDRVTSEKRGRRGGKGNDRGGSPFS